jgi:hypothetical protein
MEPVAAADALAAGAARDGPWGLTSGAARPTKTSRRPADASQALTTASWSGVSQTRFRRPVRELVTRSAPSRTRS